MDHLRNLRSRLLLLVATAVLVTAPLIAAPAEALSIPVTGTSATGATFEGAFDLQKFVVKNGVVQAVGTLTGTLTTATGKLSIVKTILGLVTIGAASCDILHLEIGPISLDLLGLQVDLNKIVLDIDAQAGPGNLLGNLLCAVAGLLDQPGGLAKLLNQILDILT